MKPLYILSIKILMRAIAGTNGTLEKKLSRFLLITFYLKRFIYSVLFITLYSVLTFSKFLDGEHQKKNDPGQLDNNQQFQD